VGLLTRDFRSDWTERRLVPLAPRTLKRLVAIMEGIKTRSGVNVEPMQFAGLPLETTTANREDVETDPSWLRLRADQLSHLIVCQRRILRQPKLEPGE
jgi:hypothetical protein